MLRKFAPRQSRPWKKLPLAIMPDATAPRNYLLSGLSEVPFEVFGLGFVFCNPGLAVLSSPDFHALENTDHP